MEISIDKCFQSVHWYYALLDLNPSTVCITVMYYHKYRHSNFSHFFESYIHAWVNNQRKISQNKRRTISQKPNRHDTNIHSFIKTCVSLKNRYINTGGNVWYYNNVSNYYYIICNYPSIVYALILKYFNLTH
jgi:hypothetical protein